jgi:CAAX protease family protein
MSFLAAAAVWAAIVALAALDGVWHGLSGREFVIALGVAAALFAFELFLAVPRVLEPVQRTLGARGGLLAPLVPLFALLIYSSSASHDWKAMLAGAAYVVVPALLVASSTGKQAGTWEDYAALLLLWLPVQFHWLQHLFPYPPQLTHSLTILLALSTGLAAFVLLRRLEGVGYALEWRREFTWVFPLLFAVYAAIAIPLGMKIGFLAWARSFKRVRSLPMTAIAILFLTAWPEEFLFRGLLQNLLSRTLNNSWAGLIVTSAIFGISHIFHAPYPNWKYVLLASIAGLFYGGAWMKTRSLVPGTLIHALVDILWHVLFR